MASSVGTLNCAAWRQALDRKTALMGRIASGLEEDWSADEHALHAEVSGAVYELEDRIFGTPATTMAGIKASAG